MSTLTKFKSNQASGLSFSESKMIISMEYGREISIPLEWIPSLRNASETELNNWRFIGDGEGIHWEDLLVSELIS